MSRRKHRSKGQRDRALLKGRQTRDHLRATGQINRALPDAHDNRHAYKARRYDMLLLELCS